MRSYSILVASRSDSLVYNNYGSNVNNDNGGDSIDNGASYDTDGVKMKLNWE